MIGLAVLIALAAPRSTTGALPSVAAAFPALAAVEADSPSLRNCALFVQEGRKPPDRLVQFIASALVATAYTDQGRPRLAPDAARRSALGAANRARAYAEPLAALAPNAFRDGDPQRQGVLFTERLLEFASSDGYKNSPNTLTPGDALLDRALVDLGPAALASLPFDEPVVYSSKPVKGELPLPKSVQKAVSAFGAMGAVVSAMLPQAAQSQYDPLQLAWIREQAEQASDVARAVLVLRRGRGSVWCSLGLYSRQGRLRGTANRVLAASPPRQALPTPLKEPIAPSLGEGARRYQEALGMLAAQRFADVPREARDLLLSPSTHEPLRYGVHQALSALFAGEERTVVIALPASWTFMPLRMDANGAVDMAAFRERLSRDLEIALAEPDALVLRPKNPDDELDSGIDKAQLERAAEHTLKRKGWDGPRGYLVAYDRCNVTAETCRDWHAYLGLLNAAGVSSPRPDMERPAALSFLGRLSARQWTELLEAKSLPLDALSPRQSRALRNWVDDALFAGAKQPQAEGAPDALRLGAEAFANAGSSAARLCVEVRSEYVLRLASCPDNQRDAWPTGDLTTEFVRDRLANLRHFGFRDAELAWRWGVRTSYVFSIVVPPGIAFEQSLPWTQDDRSSAPVGLKGLPDEIRSELGERG